MFSRSPDRRRPAADVLEGLEPRRLFAASFYNVNFQPDGVDVPSYFRADTGAAYGVRKNGLTYGWSTDSRANAVDRDNAGVSNQAYDTFVNMQAGGNRTWEIAVANGKWDVEVVAGDPSAFTGQYKIDVEGVRAIDGVPSSGNRFLTGNVTVNVTDGRLTVSNVPGAVNNKLAFVRLRRTPPAVSWSNGPQLPAALGEVGAAQIGRKVCVVGDGNDATYAYNLDTDAWETLAARPVPAKDQVAVAVDGKLYVFGGVTYSGNTPVFYDDLQIYNPSSDSWSAGQDCPWANAAAQVAVINGRIYVAGGITTGNVSTSQFAVYDPTDDSWVDLPEMPVVRNSAPAGTDGRRLYVFGGRSTGDNPEVASRKIYVYDTVTGAWRRLQVDLPDGRGGIVAAPYDAARDEFFLMGGETTSTVVGRVDVFNPNAGTFRQVASLPTPRHGITPVLVNDDGNASIFVAGGGTVVGKSESKVLQILDI
jgi:N-acetylneuraminic acid mutarotase